ncbi:MAG: hypothetical protein IMZ64_06230 [Bacteroidetes bacterium]|nr:hypothetical protein [Bacteroidota bacterium]
MGLVADWIAQKLGLASILPHPAIVIQVIALVSFFTLSFLFVPGFKLKIAAFGIAFIGVVVI